MAEGRWRTFMSGDFLFKVRSVAIGKSGSRLEWRDRENDGK